MRAIKQLTLNDSDSNVSIAPDIAGFSFISIDGNYQPLSTYLGQVVLIVNVASQCGFRGQYAGLTTLYNRYRDQGLEILAVPCDDFGQEPSSPKEIKAFAIDGYQAEFPLMQKASVKGMLAHPFYEWAKAQAKQQGLGTILTQVPRWNFHKYLIDRNGKLIGSYTPLTKPDSEALRKDIEVALAK